MILLFLSCHFFNTKDQGWHFYHDQENVKEEKPKTFKDLKKKAQEYLEEAIWEPTPMNVLRYQRIQKYIMEKGQRFSDVWARVLIDNPQLDNTIDHPTSYYGAMAKRDSDQKERTQRMHQIAERFGLVLLVGDDDASESLKKVVHYLVQQRKIQYMEIDRYQSQELAFEWGVKRLPCLLMVEIDSGMHAVVTYGLLSVDQIEAQMIRNVEGEKR